MDRRTRIRAVAELPPASQAAVDAAERSGLVDPEDPRWLALIQDRALVELYEHYRGEGMSGLAAIQMAGDDVGLSPPASRMRYYRSIRPSSDAA